MKEYFLRDYRNNKKVYNGIGIAIGIILLLILLGLIENLNAPDHVTKESLPPLIITTGEVSFVEAEWDSANI